MGKWLLFIVIASCAFLGGLSLKASTAIKENHLHRLRRDSPATSCVLPSQPPHGRYSIVGETVTATPGETVNELTFLKIKCLPNYVPSSTHPIYCLGGKWHEEKLTCLKTCKPLVSSSSTRYNCTFNQDTGPCKKPMPPGTKAILSCKENYKSRYLPEEAIFCMENGEWEDSVIICTPECGTISEGLPLAINALKAHQNYFPWHAAIYDKVSSTEPNVPDYICGGTIVSSNKIISAAHCFWDGKHQKARSAESFAVGYGKGFREWKNKNEEFAMYTDVKQLLIHPDYHDIYQNYEHDIAIVVLVNVVEFNRMIKPICIDWSDDSRDGTEPGDLGKVLGWGITEKSNLPVVSRKVCKEHSPTNLTAFVTSDKICAGYANGSSLCHGRPCHGGGFIFYDNGTNAYYLKGIVSIGPVDDLFKYTLFTSVVKYLPWLLQEKVYKEPEVFVCTSGKRITVQDKCDGILDCDDGSDESEELCTKIEAVESSGVLVESCVLPEKPGNGSYTVYGSKIAPLAWTRTKEGTILEYKCNNKFTLTSISTVKCSEGQWHPSLPSCVIKPCEPLERKTGTKFECVLDKVKNVSCDDPILPGTEVSVSCHPSFNHPDIFVSVLTCGEDSSWNFPLIHCKGEPCEPLERKDGTKFECVLDKIKNVSCDDPILPGTEVTVSCHPTFNHPDIFVSVLTCGEDSSWNFPLVNCETVCGDTSRIDEMTNEIVHKYGKEYLKVADFPSRAYIYEKVPDGDPVLICNGTLGTDGSSHKPNSSEIFTDKRCFTDNEGKLKDFALFAVGMAKLHEGWHDERDKFAFYSDFQNKCWAEAKGNGIELLSMPLGESIPFSYLIRPVCGRTSHHFFTKE